MVTLVCASLLSWSAAAAPEPPRPKPRFEVVLRADAKKSPLDDEAFRVEIRNNTDKDLELLSTLPGGPVVFLDADVRGGKDGRISKEFFWAVIASPFSSPRPVGTIPAGKSLKLDVRVFQGVEKDDLVPGKYRCRVRFRYDTVDVLSDWVTVELTGKQLADQ